MSASTIPVDTLKIPPPSSNGRSSASILLINISEKSRLVFKTLVSIPKNVVKVRPSYGIIDRDSEENIVLDFLFPNDPMAFNSSGWKLKIKCFELPDSKRHHFSKDEARAAWQKMCARNDGNRQDLTLRCLVTLPKEEYQEWEEEENSDGLQQNATTTALKWDEFEEQMARINKELNQLKTKLSELDDKKVTKIEPKFFMLLLVTILFFVCGILTAQNFLR